MTFIIHQLQLFSLFIAATVVMKPLVPEAAEKLSTSLTEGVDDQSLFLKQLEVNLSLRRTLTYVLAPACYQVSELAYCKAEGCWEPTRAPNLFSERGNGNSRAMGEGEEQDRVGVGFDDVMLGVWDVFITHGLRISGLLFS